MSFTASTFIGGGGGGSGAPVVCAGEAVNARMCARQGVHAHCGCSRVSPVRPHAAESHPWSIAPGNEQGRCKQPQCARARAEARPIRKRHFLGSAVQCSAALSYAAAVLRSAAGASMTNVRAWAMRSERAHRWIVALAHAADAHLRAPAGEALHAHSDAAIERHRALQGRCPGTHRPHVAALRPVVRPLPPRSAAPAASSGAMWVLRLNPCQGTPVRVLRVLHVRPRVLILPRTAWPSTARLCVSAWTSALAQSSSQKRSAWPTSATHNGLSREGRGAASQVGGCPCAMGFAHACVSGRVRAPTR